MKTVYIDVLVTVNIFVDFFLILCTQKLLNIRAKLLRVIFGSLAGGVFSLAALLPPMPFGLNFLTDLLSAAALIIIAFGFSSPKVFLRRAAVYFALSFIFCGVMIFVYNTFHPAGMEIYNDTVYFNISPFLLIILSLVCYYIMKLIKRLTKGVCGKRVCQIEIELNNDVAAFSAAVDTGCNVKEPFSGDYVIIAEDSILRDLHLTDDKMRVIPFGSLGGNGFIRGYRVSRLKIDGRESEHDVYLGVCENVLKGEIKALVPYEITEGEVI